MIYLAIILGRGLQMFQGENVFLRRVVSQSTIGVQEHLRAENDRMTEKPICSHGTDLDFLSPPPSIPVDTGYMFSPTFQGLETPIKKRD